MVTNKANKRPEGTQGHATYSRGFSRRCHSPDTSKL
ncbi:hypothetical protein NDA10_001975, partial [Ustilago hordei]